jgi:hypothetical protein
VRIVSVSRKSPLPYCALLMPPRECNKHLRKYQQAIEEAEEVQSIISFTILLHRHTKIHVIL